MDLLGKTPINPILFFTGKILGYMTWVSFLLSFFNIFVIRVQPILFLKYSACVLFILGLLIIVTSLFNLGNSTRLGLPVEDTVFKTNGLYRISRNPMYLGFNLLTLASILLTPHIFIIVFGLYSITVYHFIILGEERFLTEKFKKEYTDYQRSVRRYI